MKPFFYITICEFKFEILAHQGFQPKIGKTIRSIDLTGVTCVTRVTALILRIKFGYTEVTHSFAWCYLIVFIYRS